MKCKKCKNLAEIHLTEVSKEKLIETHLCQSCTDKMVGLQTSVKKQNSNYQLNLRAKREKWMSTVFIPLQGTSFENPLDQIKLLLLDHIIGVRRALSLYIRLTRHSRNQTSFTELDF